MAREFRTVGVVGLGTMGAGIVEVFARNGLHVIAVEIDDDAVARGRAHLEHSTARAVGRGKLTRGGRRRAARADHHHRRRWPTSPTPTSSSRPCPSSSSSRRAVFGELDKVCRPDAILATNTSSLSVTELAVRTGRPGRVSACTSSTRPPCMRLVEVVRTVVTEPDVVDDVKALRRHARQGARRDRRPGGLHRQRAAVRLPQPRRADVRGSATPPARTSTPPCGSAAATRWARSRCSTSSGWTPRTRSSRRCTRVPQPAARPRADPQAHDHRGPAGPQDAAAASTPTRARTARRWCRTRTTPPGDRPEPAARDVQRVGVVGSGTMATGIVEVFAKAGLRRRARAPAARRRPTAAHGRGAQVAGQGRRARQAQPRTTRDAADRPRHRHYAAGGLRRRRPRRRGRRRGPGRSSRRSSPRSTRSASRARSWPPPRPRCRCRVRRAPPRGPQDVIGMHFFNPAPVMKLVEVVSHGLDRAGRRGHRARGVRTDRQDAGALRRPGGVHRQRPALPVPQRRREDAGGALRHGRRHRRRDEDGLRLPDGPVRAAGRGRAGRVAGHRAGALPGVPRAGLRARRRCWSTWSRPGGLGRKTGHGFRDYNGR